MLYKAESREVKVDVLLRNENIWLPQKRIAELFDVDRSVITKHLKNIFESDELDKKVVSVKIAQTTQHGAIKGREQVVKSNFIHLMKKLQI